MVMKKLRKAIAVALSMAMILTAMPVSAAGFSDVNDSDWYAGSVERWSDADILQGNGSGEFEPKANITRAQVARILFVMLGYDDNAEYEFSTSFTDVKEADWFYDEVMALTEAGVIAGLGNGKFGPNEPITREAAFRLLAVGLGLKGIEDVSALDKFADGSKVAFWAAKEVAAIVESGAVVGDTNTAGESVIRPQDFITRGEVAKILDRLIAIYVTPAGDVSVTTEVDNTADNKFVGNVVVVNKVVAKDVEVKLTEEGKIVITATVDGEEVTKEVEISRKEDNSIPNVTVVQGADAKEEGEDTGVDSDVITPGGKECDGSNHVTTGCTNCAAGYTEKVTCPDGICEDEEGEYFEAHPHTFKDGACTCCKMTEDDALKFYAKVSSVCEEEENYVEALVTNDYAAKLTVTPGKVSASNVTVAVKMKDVASMGVDGVKQHVADFSTGLNGDPELSTWLSNVFGFGEGTITAKIGDTEKITYSLKGDGEAYVEGNDAVITATPSDVELTRAAWQEMTSHIASGDNLDADGNATEDSYIEIANGSYMIVGDDKLSFEKGLEDNLLLDGFTAADGMSSLEEEIRSKVQLNTNAAYLSDDYQAKFYLAAGTKLAVSSSMAVLEDNCTITVDGLNAADFAEVLPNLQKAEGGYAMAQELVQMINKMVLSADTTKDGYKGIIDVVMTFDEVEEKDTKFYLGVSAANADGNGTTTVDMEVFDDYSLEINLPMNKLNAGKVDLYVMMKNVASMGVNGVKEHSLSVDTGMSSVDGDLNTWMSNAPLFTNATINVDIEGEKCSYYLESDMDADWVTVTGTVDEDEARAAWQMLMNYIDSGDNTDAEGNVIDDSFVKINNKSYMEVGTEKLAFETKEDGTLVDDLVLDNFGDLGTLKQNIKNSVVLTQDGKGGIELFVGKGTELAVSSSKAVLNSDCKITIEGATLPANTLKDIQTAANGDTAALVKALFTTLNNVVGAANGATLDVTVEFGE